MTKCGFLRSIVQILLIALLLNVITSLRADLAVKQTGAMEAEMNGDTLDNQEGLTQKEWHQIKSERQAELNGYLKAHVRGPAELWYILVAGVRDMSSWMWNQATVKAHIHWSTHLYFGLIFFAIALVIYIKLGKKMEEEDGKARQKTPKLSVLDYGTLYPRLTFIITLILIGGNAIGSLLKAPILVTDLMALLMIVAQYLSFVSNDGSLRTAEAKREGIFAPIVAKVAEIFNINLKKKPKGNDYWDTFD